MYKTPPPVLIFLFSSLKSLIYLSISFSFYLSFAGFLTAFFFPFPVRSPFFCSLPLFSIFPLCLLLCTLIAKITQSLSQSKSFIFMNWDYYCKPFLTTSGEKRRADDFFFGDKNTFRDLNSMQFGLQLKPPHFIINLVLYLVM